jgi:hypothetical protein
VRTPHSVGRNDVRLLSFPDRDVFFGFFGDEGEGDEGSNYT